MAKSGPFQPAKALSTINLCKMATSSRRQASSSSGAAFFMAWRSVNLATHTREEPSETSAIADGHHRYATAMNYRDSLGGIGPDHEADFVMFALVARDDPGLLILPTHRIMSGLGGVFAIEKLAAACPEFSWLKVETSAADLINGLPYIRQRAILL